MVQGLLAQVEELKQQPEVLKSPKLKPLFDDLQEQLAKGALAAFSYAFSFYLMTNNYEAPKEVLAFASQINHHLPKQRGRGSAFKMLALSLMGLSK